MVLRFCAVWCWANVFCCIKLLCCVLLGHSCGVRDLCCTLLGLYSPLLAVCFMFCWAWCGWFTISVVLRSISWVFYNVLGFYAVIIWMLCWVSLLCSALLMVSAVTWVSVL